MIKYGIFVAVVFFSLSTASFGQDQRVVDSLRLALKHQTGGKKFRALYELAFQYIRTDNEQALELIRGAEAAALLSGDSIAIVKSRRVKGQLFYFLERSDAAQRTLQAILPIAVRNGFQQEYLYIQVTLGKLALYSGRYDIALASFFKSLGLSQQLEATNHTAMVLADIGTAYYKLKNYAQGLNYYKKCVSTYQFDPATSCMILTNIGLCYVQLGDFSRAQSYIEKGLEYCQPNCTATARINVEYAFGLIYFFKKQFAAAEGHFLASYALAKKSRNTRFQLDNIYLLTEIYMDQENIDKAHLYLLEAERIINDQTPFNLEMIKIYSRFFEFYLSRKDFRNASLYQSRYIALKDSISNEEVTTRLMRAEADFLERENVARLNAQQEVIELKEEVISHQKNINILTGLVGGIAVVFLVFLSRDYRRKKRLNNLLDKKVTERTRELEVSRNELSMDLMRMQLSFHHATQTVNERVNTLRGLCCAGRREICDADIRKYFEEIDYASRQINNCLQSVSLNQSVQKSS